MSEQEFAKRLGRNLRRMMYEKNITQAQMSKELGIGKTTLSTWMNGQRMPRMDKIDILCRYLNCKRSDLMDDNRNAPALSRRIPVLGRVAAGIPIEMIEDVLDWEEIDGSYIGDFFGLKVKGDSMSPRIMEGDVLIVRSQPDAESGDIVIAQVNGNEATCKRLLKHNGGISLISLNPAYPPMIFSEAEKDVLPVSIIGKVVENRQKY